MRHSPRGRSETKCVVGGAPATPRGAPAAPPDSALRRQPIDAAMLSATHAIVNRCSRACRVTRLAFAAQHSNTGATKPGGRGWPDRERLSVGAEGEPIADGWPPALGPSSLHRPEHLNMALDDGL